MTMMNNMLMNWDYVAGYFDGEGSAYVLTQGRGELSWTNTHRASLEAMQQFIQAGDIRDMERDTSSWSVLKVHRIDDLKRIIPELQARCIVKQDALGRLSQHIESKQGRPAHGILSRLGSDNVASLYYELGTGTKVADLLGCDPSSVYHFMKKHDIPKLVREQQQLMAQIRPVLDSLQPTTALAVQVAKVARELWPEGEE